MHNIIILYNITSTSDYEYVMQMLINDNNREVRSYLLCQVCCVHVSLRFLL